MKNTKKILDKYLPNKTGSPVEALEKEIIMAMEECARKYHIRQLKKIILKPSVTDFPTRKKCEQEAIKVTKDELKLVNTLLPEDYRTGFKEGIEHYLYRLNNIN